MVWRGGGEAAETAACTPPHDILDRPVGGHLPRGDAAAALLDLMDRARAVIAGRGAATDIWLWGQGRAPSIGRFADTWSLSGAVVGAVDLVKGIGRYAGFDVPDVPGATGDLDTDYGSKARVALAELEEHDFVFVHVEAPDEAGHMGDAGEKVKAIERIDAEVLGPLLESRLDPAVLVVPDHPTPVRLRTHVGWPVPFVYGCGRDARAAAPAVTGERAATAAGPPIASGRVLMGRFLGVAAAES
jgi:2,3-bisphosphoglycerate-independent phosphoglycerate mutase